MGLLGYLKLFRRYWLVVAFSVISALAIALLAGGVNPPPPPEPVYEATAYLLNSNTGSQTSQATLADPAAVAGLATIAPIPEGVAERIGFEGDPQTLVQRVSVAADPETGFVTIRSVSTEARSAERLASAFADELLERLVELKADENRQRVEDLKIQIAGLEEDLAAAEPDGPEALTLQGEIARLRSTLRAYGSEPDPGFRIVTPATAHLIPTDGFQAPRSVVGRVAIASVVGLIFGLSLALIVGQVDTRIHTKEIAEETFGLPVLIEIPVLPGRDRGSIVTQSRPGSLPAHAFQLLAAEVVRGVSPNGSRRRATGGSTTLLVTSAGPGEGKSLVVANLAVALADISKNVIVLSCDFRRPTLHELFGVPRQEGLVDAIMSSNKGPILPGLMQKTSVDGVWLVPSGPHTDAPGRLLRSEEMTLALKEARAEGDIVLIDTPPILVASDAMLLLPEVDAVLVVTHSRRTTTTSAERTMDLLRRVNAPVAGVILNRVAGVSKPRGYGRYHRSHDRDGGFPGLARHLEGD